MCVYACRLLMCLHECVCVAAWVGERTDSRRMLTNLAKPCPTIQVDARTSALPCVCRVCRVCVSPAYKHDTLDACMPLLTFARRCWTATVNRLSSQFSSMSTTPSQPLSGGAPGVPMRICLLPCTQGSFAMYTGLFAKRIGFLDHVQRPLLLRTYASFAMYLGLF